MSWHALTEARRQVRPRRPFVVDNERVGSVDEAHLSTLQPWVRWVEVRAEAVVLTAGAPKRDAIFTEMNHRLRAQGLIRAWRDEPFPLLSPTTGRVLAVFERASARFWGTLTLGAHATGFVRGTDGRVERLWIARRSEHKATDPGLLDNLVGGGVPAGQSAREALVREGHEEAGLSPGEMASARPAGVLRLHRDVAEGLQHEWLHAFDLELSPGRVPLNQDGEVASFAALGPGEALACATSGRMTVDAALVTIDFLLRHDLLDDAAAEAGVEALRVHTVPPVSESPGSRSIPRRSTG